MFCNWLISNSGELISALICAVATITAVVLTIKMESKQRRKDEIIKAKPIVINYDASSIDDLKTIAQIMFCANQTDDDEKTGSICGTFKNTDNGVLFIDYIETESKEYLPITVTTIDKNTIFQIYVKIVKGETLKTITIYCHDIYGNKYKYNAIYKPESFENRIELINGEPILIQKSK